MDPDPDRRQVMRLIVTGADTEGRSEVQRVEELGSASPQAGTGLIASEVWSSAQVQDALATRPRTGEFRPLPCGPGEISWRFVRHDAGATFGVHRTDTIDCDTVLEGQVSLGLDNGSIDLVPGDLVLIPGVAHSWHAGSEGCTLSVVLIGLEP
jgi:hypothetical protein